MGPGRWDIVINTLANTPSVQNHEGSDGLKTSARFWFWVFSTQVAICGNYRHCWPPQRPDAKSMFFSFNVFYWHNFINFHTQFFKIKSIHTLSGPVAVKPRPLTQVKVAILWSKWASLWFQIWVILSQSGRVDVCRKRLCLREWPFFFFSMCIRRGCQADGLHRCLRHVCVHMSVCKYFCVCMCV